MGLYLLPRCVDEVSASLLCDYWQAASDYRRALEHLPAYACEFYQNHEMQVSKVATAQAETQALDPYTCSNCNPCKTPLAENRPMAQTLERQHPSMRFECPKP